MPELMSNHGMYIVSPRQRLPLARTAGGGLGVEIYPGFAAAEVLFDDGGAVRGVATGDMGVARDGSHKSEYQPGMELVAKYTLFAEGCRGSLSQELMQKFNLRDGVDPQKYGIGIKELWQVAPDKHHKGLVLHSQGWPLDTNTGGGSFIYHYGEGLVSVGFVVHLNYENRTCRRTTSSSGSRRTGDPRHVRWRQAHLVRRARDQRGRVAIGAEALVSGGRIDRMRGPDSSICPRDQGLAQRNENRNARRRGGIRRNRRRKAARRAHGIRRSRSGSLGCTRICTKCAT
jgi:flavin-dependent dehydrogenase